MHKVFISYHHKDQKFKDELAAFGEKHGIFEDCSVETDDIANDGSISSEKIRKKIRDEYLIDTTVTIVLVGQETRKRKHIDWEIHSSMIDGDIYSKSGILVVNLHTIGKFTIIASHDGEGETVYREIKKYVPVAENGDEYRRRYPYMPDRIIDNLVKPKVKISVTNWSTCFDAEKLRFLVEAAHRDRESCEYHHGDPIRRKNT